MFVTEVPREAEHTGESLVEGPMEHEVAWSIQGCVGRHDVRMNARLRQIPAWWPLGHLQTLYSHDCD